MFLIFKNYCVFLEFLWVIQVKGVRHLLKNLTRREEVIVQMLTLADKGVRGESGPTFLAFYASHQFHQGKYFLTSLVFHLGNMFHANHIFHMSH